MTDFRAADQREISVIASTETKSPAGCQLERILQVFRHLLPSLISSGTMIFDLGPMTFDLGRITFELGPMTFDLGPMTFDLNLMTFGLGPMTILLVNYGRNCIFLGPTVCRGPRNYEPTRGFCVFTSRADPWNLPRNSSFYRGIRIFSPRTLTFFNRTTEKMTSMLWVIDD